MANGNQDYDLTVAEVIEALQDVEELYSWRVHDIEMDSTEDDGDSEGDDTEGL